MSVTMVVNVDEADQVTLPIRLSQKYTSVNTCDYVWKVCKSYDRQNTIQCLELLMFSVAPVFIVFIFSI